MNDRSEPKATDDDVAELKDEWFEEARPAVEVLPTKVMEAVKRNPGRNPGHPRDEALEAPYTLSRVPNQNAKRRRDSL